MGEREGYSHSNASSKDSLTLHRKSVSDFWMEPRAGQTMLALHRGPWNWRRKEGAGLRHSQTGTAGPTGEPAAEQGVPKPLPFLLT